MITVVFEGLNGSGKSTQARLLARRLEREGRDVVVLRDPGGTPLGERLRVLLKSTEVPIDSYSQTLLFTAARRALVCEKIECGSVDRVVILDRWWFSTYAYQGVQGVPGRLVKYLSRRFSLLPLSRELCFLLEVSPEAAVSRSRRVDEGEDRFEAQGLEFQAALAERYRDLVPQYLTSVDAETQTVEQIHEQIWERVASHLGRATK